MKKVFSRTVLFAILSVFAATITFASAGPNLISNPSVEDVSMVNKLFPPSIASPVGWNKTYDVLSGATFAFPVSGYNSPNALNVQVAKYRQGDNGWYFNKVNITANTQYVFSDYYISNVATYLTAIFKLSGGSTVKTDLAQIPVASQWTQAQATFTSPANAVSVYITHALRSNGSLTTDTYSLNTNDSTITPPPPPPPTPDANLIPNPLLENGTTSPASWAVGSWGVNDAVFNYPVPGFTGQGASVTIKNYTSGDAKWYFNSIPVTPGKYYVFSDEYMSDASTQVVIQFQSLTGASSYQEIGLPAPSATWQNFQAGFIVPLGMNSLTIFHLLDSVGTLTTDNYSLIQTADPNAFNKGMVSLTFDDGWQATYNNGLPILNAAGLKSTQYIISGSIGNIADGYMTLPEIIQMYNAGHDIATHTRTHPDLTLPATDLQSEINGSRNDLLKNFKPVDSFAYPYGKYNPTIQADVLTAGFSGARTVDLGYNDRSTDKTALKVQIVERGGICGTDNAPTTTLAQVKNWIDTASATNTWLILVFHQIDNVSSNCYGSTPIMLQNIINYLKASNVDVVTVSQGLQK